MEKIKEKSIKFKENQRKINEERKIEQDKITLLSHITDLSKFSYEMEEKREESLIRQSGQMITMFSIISVAEIMMLPILLLNITKLSKMYIFTWVIVITIPLLISLLLAFLAQWRYKYQALPSPKVIFEHVSKEYDKFLSTSVQLQHWNDTIENLYNPKRINNQKRAKLIVSSMKAFLVSMGLMVIGFIISISIIIK